MGKFVNSGNLEKRGWHLFFTFLALNSKPLSGWMNCHTLTLKSSLGFVMTIQVVGVCCYLIWFYSVPKLRETFSTDLDYNEI